MNQRKKQINFEEKLNLTSLMNKVPLDILLKSYLKKLERDVREVNIVDSYGYLDLGEFVDIDISPEFFVEDYESSIKIFPILIEKLSYFFDKNLIMRSGNFELRIIKNSGYPEIGIYKYLVPFLNKNHKPTKYYSKKFVELVKKEGKHHFINNFQ